MEERVRAKVSRSRNVNMFGELSYANWVLLENALEKRDEYLYDLMSCLVFAAFKHEAFINHIGFRLIPNWNELERCPGREKLEALEKHLGLNIDNSRRPFQTLHDLFAARDQLAHGKPVLLEHENIVEAGTREEIRRRKPLTKWELLCTIEFAKRAYDDTEEIAEMLWSAAGLDVGELRSRGHSYSISDANR